MTEPFVLGVNYWPRRKAMYWWSDFDAGEVREEFAIIQSLGMSLVRIFLLWDDWQPAPDHVPLERVAALERVCDAALEHGLALDVTFFTGHMSGPNWAPRWLLDATARPPKPGMLVSGGRAVDAWYRNPYHDETARRAQRLLLETVVSALAQHPAIRLWNLGNEPDLFAVADTREASDAWTREMTGVIREADDRTPVTFGLHVESLRTRRAPRVDTTFSIVDVPAMHAYPMYTPWVDDPLDPWFVPFTCALTTALCGKPTLMEEFGGCTAPPGRTSETIHWTAYGRPRSQFMASEEALAEYYARVLPNLVTVGATGAVAWCFADYAPGLWDRPPCLESRHERHFGLVRPDGSLKPHAEAIRRFAATRPTVRPAAVAIELGTTPDGYYDDPEETMKARWREFRKRAAQEAP